MLKAPLRGILGLLVFGCGAMLATADPISIGLLTFDTNGGQAAFNITNLTGGNAFAPSYPVTTQLTITVTSLVAELEGGGTLTIPASDFSVVDPQGDINCSAAGDAASGGCNFAPYNIASATLTGTLSPLTGLAGLPAGDSGIESSFTTTILPDLVACGNGTTLTAGCDSAVINASGVVATPEPATWTLLGIGLIGLVAGYKLRSSRGVC